MKTETARQYLGVDVGGTKILAALVAEDGTVRARKRMPTPRDVKGPQVAAAIGDVIAVLLAEKGVHSAAIAGIGLAIPGTVAPDEGRIVLTPNMPLSGIAIGPLMQKRFTVPVVIGNDVNLGTLGEAWLGAARGAQTAVGVFVGTGIGAGVVVNGRLHEGCRNAAGEIGHVCMEIGGPECGCGNRGCLEALASRTAIERAIREEIEHGRRSIVGTLTSDLSVIKSSVLKRALKQDDELVAGVMRKASEMIGYACLTVRHLLDPDVIVLGGGVIEACGDFMVPIIEQIVRLHSLPGSREKNIIATSKLGDDAVVLGAVALVLGKERAGTAPAATASMVVQTGNGFAVGGETFTTDFIVRPDGTARARTKAEEKPQKAHVIGAKDVEAACADDTSLLVVGAARPKQMLVSAKARAALGKEIECRIVPLAEAARLYNAGAGRVALLIHWN